MRTIHKLETAPTLKHLAYNTESAFIYLGVLSLLSITGIYFLFN